MYRCIDVERHDIISMMVMCNANYIIEYDERRLELPNALVVIEHDNNRTEK